MKNFGKHPILFVLLILTALVALSGTVRAAGSGYFVRGIVRDSISGETMSNVFVTIKGGKGGTVTDSQGIFEITVPNGKTTLSIRCQGYNPKDLNITQNRVNLYAIELSPATYELDEVVIKRPKYSKKNNPAVDLMRHIRATAETNDPRRNPYYNYNTYQKISIALDDVDPLDKKGLLARFPFLVEHIDTSEISGRLILPVSIREQSSEVHHRAKPQSRHEVITGRRSDGIDEILDKESMDRFMNDILGEVDIYSRDINILQNRFVSPLSPIAADFYKFYLTDSLVDAGRKYYVLSFYPHNRSTFGFVGTMEVAPTDTSAFVRSINMRVPAEINLNFIESLAIHQRFKEAEDHSRLKTVDEMTMEVKIIPGTQGLYARRVMAFSGHNFDRPDDELRIFAPRAPITIAADAAKRDSTFWASVNPVGLSHGESKVATMMTRLRRVPIYYWGEKVLKVLVTGYIPTAENSKFDVGPMNTSISTNPLEGLRLRAGGMTTAALNPRLFTRFYGAYGFRDHRWKYGVELEYSFHDKMRHSREFPIHSLRFNSSYDVDRPGQHYMFTNPDNIFLSLKRPGDDPMTYRRFNALTYTLELETHFSVKAIVANERQWASRRMPFDLSGGGSLYAFNETYAEVELRYAPGEKFYQTASNRFPINLDAPVVALTHRWAPDAFGSRAPLNITSLSFQKRFWLSAFGFIDCIVKGGHVWSKNTPFNHLFIANTNLSYTIQPESFALTAPMEFVADSYGMFDVTYWANGAILNYIPLIKKLRLREAFGIRGFYGHLSKANDPSSTAGLIMWPGCMTQAERLRTPYFEASVGLDNILRCLRVDYVWRLNHRNSPLDAASDRGVRVAFHVTF